MSVTSDLSVSLNRKSCIYLNEKIYFIIIIELNKYITKMFESVFIDEPLIFFIYFILNFEFLVESTQNEKSLDTYKDTI